MDPWHAAHDRRSADGRAGRLRRDRTRRRCRWCCCATPRRGRAASTPIRRRRRRRASGWSRSTGPATAAPTHWRPMSCRRSPATPPTRPRCSTTSASPAPCVAGWSAGGRVAAALAAARPELVGRALRRGHPGARRRGAVDRRGVPPGDHGHAVRPGSRRRPRWRRCSDRHRTIRAPSWPIWRPGRRTQRCSTPTRTCASRVVAMLAGAVEQGPVGVAADIVSYTVADWGFDPAAIGAPTTCVYGDADRRLPGPRRVVGGPDPGRRARRRRRRRPPRRRAGVARGAPRLAATEHPRPSPRR